MYDSGDLLISPVHMPDPRFKETVMLLTHDNDHGSFALCLNKPMPRQVSDVIEDQIDITNFPDQTLYWGGPVSPHTIWMLHDSDWCSEHTVSVNDQWSMTSHLSMFHSLAQGDTPRHFRICSGFAAWAVGQLEMEIQGQQPWRPESSWLIAHDASAEWALDQDESQLWKNSVALSANQAIGQWM
jgi:putative transcriptional regulator